MSTNLTTSQAEMPSIFALIQRRWQWAVGIFSAIVVGGLAYTALVPAVWEAKTTLIFPTRMPSVLGSQGFAESTSLAATLTGQATPLKVYKGILESERALNYVAKNSGLKKRKILDDRDVVDQSMESTITLSYRNHDAELAKKVVQLHLDALATINRDISSPLFFDDANVLKVEVTKQEKRVQDTEAKLLAFQKTAVTAPGIAQTGSGKDSTVVSTTGSWVAQLRQLELEKTKLDTAISTAKSRTNRLAKLPTTIATDLPPARRWRTKLAEMEYNLRIALQTQPESSPEIQRYRDTIRITKEQFEKELTSYVRGINAETLDATTPETTATTLAARVVVESQISAVQRLAKLAPEEAVKLSRIMRELSVQSIILQQLQSQYQLCKLQKARDPNKWEVLDTPEVDDKPVNKSFSKNGAIAAFLGLVLGCIVAGLLGNRDYLSGTRHALVSVEVQEAEQPLQKAQ